jgi:hypothetical protein
MNESPGLVALVREALEGVLSPPTAASTLFAALDGTSVPTDRASVIRFVDGPLRSVLVQRLGKSEAAGVVDRILMPLEASTRPGANRRVDEDKTKALPLSTHAVPVTIVSETSGLANRLRAALGTDLIDVSATASAADAVAQQPEAAIVVLDASDFPPSTVDAVAGALRLLPETTACVVYAAELPFGQRALKALALANRDAVAIARADGVDPLLDLVCARRSEP